MCRHKIPHVQTGMNNKARLKMQRIQECLLQFMLNNEEFNDKRLDRVNWAKVI